MFTAAVVVLCIGSACLLAQPSWTNFTYTDWNPGVNPAIWGVATQRHYECRSVWDGTQFVNIHEQDRTAPANYSYWISSSSDGQTWTAPTAIDVPRTWDCGHHALACDPNNFPDSDTMNGDTDIKFKLWYAAYGDNYRYRYAESTDGISWTAAAEYLYCPPYYKVSNFNPGSCGTTKIMIKPDVLYRPDGSDTLDMDNPMNNRYIMYLGSSVNGSCSGNPGYFEMYVSHNGLEWKLYAWDTQCQTRWETPPGPGGKAEVRDIISFVDCSTPSSVQYVNSLEEVYENGERQGFMLWTDEFQYPIYSFFSTNGVDWTCREEPVSTIGERNLSSNLNWNFVRNYNFDSVRVGESYFITRSGRTDLPSVSYSFGAAIIKGNMSAEVETPADPSSGDVTINYKLYSWNAGNCPQISATYSMDGSTFETAAMGSGGDGTANLNTAIGGESHTFVWNSLADLPNGAPDVYFRVQPHPAAGTGSYDTTDPFDVNWSGQPTPTPTPLPNYINLTANPVSFNPGEGVTLGWTCDFSRWNYEGIPVNIYLAAIKSPKVIDAPSSVKDALAGGIVYLAGAKLKSVYVYRGKVKEPTWSNVSFPPVKTAGSFTIRTPNNPAIAGDYVFATAFIKADGRGFVRDDGLPVENSNLFSIR